MNEELKKWRKQGKHLPAMMRDFHDQKTLFRAIHELTINDDTIAGRKINAVEGHCYVLDTFLWFMARHGYTLQKSRANLDFESLAENLTWVQRQRDEAFKNMLEDSAPNRGTLPP